MHDELIERQHAVAVGGHVRGARARRRAIGPVGEEDEAPEGVLRELPEEIPVCWGTAIYEVQMAVAPAPDGSVRVAQVIRAAEIVWSQGEKLGFPMEAGWVEVHASNRAKVDKETGKVIRREDGKILKPEGWVGPNLQAVLEGKSGNYVDSVVEVQHG